MNLRRFICTIAVTLILIPTGLLAQTMPEPVCPPEKPDASRFVIDAASGAGAGPRSFARDERAEVLFTDLNPFRYNYRFEKNETPVQELALSAFLSLLPLPGVNLSTGDADEGKKEVDAKKEVAKAAAAPAVDQAAAAAVDRPRGVARPACPPAEEQRLKERFAKLEDIEERLGQDWTVLRGQLSRVAAKQSREVLAAERAITKLNGSSASCQFLVTTSGALVSTLTSYLKGSDLAAFAKARSAFSQGIGKAKMRLQILREDLAQASPACNTVERRQRIAALAAGLAGYGKLADDLIADEKKLDKAEKALAATRDRVRNVRQAENAFSRTIHLGEYLTRTNVSVQLKRSVAQSKDAKLETFGPVFRFNFGGGPLFTLAVGLSGADIEKNRFAIVSGRPEPTDETPDPEVQRIIGEPETSSGRVVPMAYLHGRLKDLRRKEAKSKWGSLQLSLGVTVREEGDESNLEFFLGPSLGLLDDQLFLSIGGYYGYEQSLDGGLNPRELVPMDLTALPTSVEGHWRLGFALSYKVR